MMSAFRVESEAGDLDVQRNVPLGPTHDTHDETNDDADR